MRTAGMQWLGVGVVVVVACVVAAPGASEANTAPLASSAAVAGRGADTHATRGIVQTIDAHSMVIARSGDRGRMTFSLTPSTRREDAIVVGAIVSVRFREERHTNVATAIAVQRLTSPR